MSANLDEEIRSEGIPPLEPPASEQATAPRSERSDTTYVVLALGVEADATGEEIESWTVEDDGLTARSAEAAVRSFAETLSEVQVKDGVTLVAVPARSWKPVRIKPQTVTTLVIEEA